MRKSTKGKYQLSPQAASTPATSDDEMETSFSSFNPSTEKGLVNPLYEGGAGGSATESPRPEEDGVKSKGRKQRGVVPEIRVR